MSYVAVPGSSPLWVPFPRQIYGGTPQWVISDAGLLDADEEEVQCIYTTTIDGGGSKTFGTSGSKIDWLPGASITFLTGSTLRVGVKDSSKIDTANGPVGRATVGAAAFNVYKDLVGGTDTITSTTWRSDSMASGTPFTVTDGDPLVLGWHLDTTSGSPSVKIRMTASQDQTTRVFPVSTLVTASGGTFTALTNLPNAILTFDDGTIGWLDPSHIIVSANDAQTSAIGNTNINGNIVRLPFNCKIDMLAAAVNPTTAAANFALDLYSTPLGTPSLVESIAFDANVGEVAVNNIRMALKRLTTARELTRNVDYAIGVRQTTATSVTVYQNDVNAAAHFRPNGLDGTCYAAISTAGGTFAAQASGLRRYNIYMRIAQVDDGAGGGGGGLKLIGSGGLVG